MQSQYIPEIIEYVAENTTDVPVGVSRTLSYYFTSLLLAYPEPYKEKGEGLFPTLPQYWVPSTAVSIARWLGMQPLSRRGDFPSKCSQFLLPLYVQHNTHGVCLGVQQLLALYVGYLDTDNGLLTHLRGEKTAHVFGAVSAQSQTTLHGRGHAHGTAVWKTRGGNRIKTNAKA